MSDYTHDAKNLPACKRDGAAIIEILRSSGRFDDVLHIDIDTRSTQVKQKLAEFVKSHSSETVEEIVFYFTGHGHFQDNEFYYLLSDYQQRRIKQTSLENAELDNIVRSVNPSLFVKIVDACHSGMTYIKNSEDFSEYAKRASASFKKLYFMFSSQSEQFSYQNDQISYFTESMLKAIVTHAGNSIRYKDIIDYVSDEFKILDFQTPFFVTQADFTEVLCDVTLQLKETLGLYVQDEEVNDKRPREPTKTIVDLLREDAKRFSTKEEACTIVGTISEQVEDELRKQPDLSDIYTIHVTEEDKPPPMPESVGRWIEKNKADRGYFAKPTLGTGVRKVPRRGTVHDLARAAGLITGNVVEQQLVDETYTYVEGFSFTTEMPLNHVRIRLEPSFRNLTPEECFIVPILSRTHMRLFWAFSHFEYVDWESAQRTGKLDWTTDEVPLKDKENVTRLIASIAQKFWMFVEEPIRTKWGVTLAVPSSSPPAEDGSPATGS